MAGDFALGDDFVSEVLCAAARDCAAAVLPGSSVASLLAERVGVAFCRAAWSWLSGKSAAQQQAAITALAQAPVHRVRPAVEAGLAGIACDTETRAQLVTYLTAIPMTARRAITRPNDGGQPTTLVSQLPRNEADLLRFVPLRAPRFQPGDQVPGHDYCVEALLGQGGFAEVWKARHTLREDEPPVALKFCLDPTLLVSLRVEIAAWDAMNPPAPHEGFVQLRGTAYNAAPPFLVYEYVDGGDLTAWLAGYDGKRPPVRSVVKIMRMTARALAVAHRHGVVHRDLKPANLLITREGRIKVSDFGIGAILSDAEGRSGRAGALTGATLLRGAHTPIYTDPLQPRDAAPNPKADVYALGVIGYQLLRADVTQPIGPAWRADLQRREIPDELVDVIGACVDIASRRLPDAAAVAAALDRFDSDRPPPPQEPSPFCIACGTKALRGHAFCVHCGERLLPA
jgi:Protein kinase domain